jgi:carboxypeptidase D
VGFSNGGTLQSEAEAEKVESKNVTAGPFGFLPANVTEINTSDVAAVAAWHAVQAVVSKLPEIRPKVQSRDFNLWTERYSLP